MDILHVDTFKKIYIDNFPDDLTFNYVMILASYYYKHNVVYFPITWREEDQRSNVQLLSQAFKVTKILFYYLINRDKFIKCELRKKINEIYSGKVIFDGVKK